MKRRTNKKGPCPCGSGKRYEKCCRRKVLLARSAMEKFRNRDRAKKVFTEKFGHIRVPMWLPTPDGVYTTVGNGIYKQTRPGEYTFMHALHDHALMFFGDTYLGAQEKKALHKRHPALQWMYEYVDQTERNMDQTGAGAAWYRFAYDLYTIRDNARLEEILKRDRAPRSGVRTAAAS